MISDHRLAELCAATYDPAAKWDASWETDDVHAHGFAEDGCVVVAFRGTDPEDIVDWWRDVRVLAPEPRRHPQLGLVHAGFLGDAMQVATTIRRELAGRPIIVTGHSKGAGDGLMFAALLCAAGVPPIRVTTFGSPRLGFIRLQEILRCVSGLDYRHGDDPVPLIPLPFLHPRRLIQLGARHITLDVIEDHFIDGYVTALSSDAALSAS